MRLAFHLKKKSASLKVMYDPVNVSDNFSLKKASGLKGGCGPPPPRIRHWVTLIHVDFISISILVSTLKWPARSCFSAFAVLPRLGDIYPMTLPRLLIVHAYITSRLDYCNTLYCGLPKYRIDRLQIQQLALLPRRESIIILHRFLGVYTGFLCSIELFLKHCYCLIRL